MNLWIERELFQWEKNRYVYFSNDSEQEVTYIQFYNNKSGRSIEVSLEQNKAKIPDVLLSESLPIMAVACTGKRGEGHVLFRRQFKVIKQPRPESYTDADKYIVYDGGEEN